MNNLLESQTLNDFFFNNLDPEGFNKILFSALTNSVLSVMTISILLFVLVCTTLFFIDFDYIKILYLLFLILIILVFPITTVFLLKFNDTILNKKINEIKSNISIEKHISKYPLKKTPLELSKKDTSFIINNQILDIAPNKSTKYTEREDNYEYLLLEETSYIYTECPYLEQEIFNSYIHNLKKTNPEFFYEIKEIGYKPD